jgi:hypothetical protein
MDSLVGVTIRPRVERPNNRSSIPDKEHEIFLFPITYKLVLGSTQPSTQLVPGALSLGVKWPRREADQSNPPKNGGAITPLSHTSLGSIA